MIKEKEVYTYQNLLAWLILEYQISVTWNMKIWVMVSDIFVYACADGEEVKDSQDLIEIYEAYQKDPRYGTIYWVAKRRNLEPVLEVYEKMVAAGYDFTGFTPGDKSGW